MPPQWESFISTVAHYLELFGCLDEMFSSSIYNQGAKSGECIYCSVIFAQSNRSYYYITKDDSLNIGDRVIVPIGRNGAERVATFIDKAYYTEDNLPFPLNKIKFILRKVDKSDNHEEDTRDNREVWILHEKYKTSKTFFGIALIIVLDMKKMAFDHLLHKQA